MEEDSFLNNYYESFKFIWLFVIGMGDAPEDAGYYADILTFVASISLLIIMLNVLIAIAGESLASAEAMKVEHAYKAKVELLHELMRHPVIRFAKRMKNTKNVE